MAAVFYNLRQLMRQSRGINLAGIPRKWAHWKPKQVLKALNARFGCSLPNIAAGEQLDVSRGVIVGLCTNP